MLPISMDEASRFRLNTFGRLQSEELSTADAMLQR